PRRVRRTDVVAVYQLTLRRGQRWRADLLQQIAECGAVGIQLRAADDADPVEHDELVQRTAVAVEDRAELVDAGDAGLDRSDGSALQRPPVEHQIVESGASGWSV